MRLRPHHPTRLRAFTLLELLTVMSIIVVVLALSRLAIQGLGSSGKFNSALGDAAGLLEQARAYAIAQDTYVWAVFYENTPANGGPLEVYAGAYASNDGTDPYNWTGTQTVPYSGLTSVTKLYHFTGVNLQTTSLPNAPTGSLNYPASVPIFQCNGQSSSGPVTLPAANQTYWVVQFTPTGAARNGPNPIDSIWLGMQPSFSPTIQDTHNVASLKVNGFTGLTTIYRQ